VKSQRIEKFVYKLGLIVYAALSQNRCNVAINSEFRQFHNFSADFYAELCKLEAARKNRGTSS